MKTNTNSDVHTIKGIFELSIFVTFRLFPGFCIHIFIWEFSKCPFSYLIYFPDYHFYVFYVFIYLRFLCCFACNSIHFYAFSCYYDICSSILWILILFAQKDMNGKRMKINGNWKWIHFIHFIEGTGLLRLLLFEHFQINFLWILGQKFQVLWLDVLWFWLAFGYLIKG